MVNYISNEPNNIIIKNVLNIAMRLELEIVRKGGNAVQEILTQEKSIYLQISELLENDILRDILLEEERVPSTNELAKLYVINPATAAKGINILVERGILYKKRGIGMFVAAGAKAAIQKRRKEEFFDNYVKTLLVEADSLGISKEELISMLQNTMK